LKWWPKLTGFAQAWLLTLAALLVTPGALHAEMTPEIRLQLDRSGRVDRALIERLQVETTTQLVVVYRVVIPERSKALDRAAQTRARRASIVERRDQLLARLQPNAYSMRRQFTSVPVVALATDALGVLALLGDPNVLRIGLDAQFKVQLAEAVPLVNLPALHTSGYEASGIKFATIDTGVDGAHLDLSDSLIDEQCFCSVACCPGGGNTQSGAGAADDDNGHGTQTAGVITSNGTSAPVGGANGAQLVAVKSLNAGGGGNLSDIVAGIDWVLTDQPDVSVVNISVGAGIYAGDCDTDDAVTMALAAAVDPLWESGILLVSSTGNDISGVGITTPACLSHVVSVGAVWDSDQGSQTVGGCTDTTTFADKVACFSNSSPTTDVFAPGAPTTTSRDGGGTITGHGTSLAAPLVAACALVLVQIYPNATPQELMNALSTSPVSVVDAKNSLSFPRLDCQTAMESLADAAVPSLSPGSLVILLIVLPSISWLARRRRESFTL
jgi:hypothetical protein